MKQTTDILIINLKNAILRREFMANQFEDLISKNPNSPLNYEFFTAINGKDNPHYPLFFKYNEQERYRRKGSRMTLGQLGCFASHYLAWERCFVENKNYIILEDDAILQENFMDVWQFCGSPENQFEFFWLTHSNARKHKTKQVASLPDSDTILERHYFGYSNATGYFITPQAAKKLLDYADEWIYEVDITMDRYYENGLDFLGVNPPCVKPDYSKESQTPIEKGKSQRTLKIKFRREMFNLSDRLKRLRYWRKNN